MATVDNLGAVYTLAGTNLATGYSASAAINLGLFERVRFYVANVRSNGSAATTTTVKLQLRYNDGSATTAYLDLPSIKDDASATLEVEHAMTTTTNATTAFTFYLADARGLLDVTVNLKVNSAGQAGDTTTVYAVACR